VHCRKLVLEGTLLFYDVTKQINCVQGKDKILSLMENIIFLLLIQIFIYEYSLLLL